MAETPNQQSEESAKDSRAIPSGAGCSWIIIVFGCALLFGFSSVDNKSFTESLKVPTGVSRDVGVVSQSVGAAQRSTGEQAPDLATTTGFILTLGPNEQRKGLQLAIPCPPGHIPGLRGHMESTGTASLHINWGAAATGPSIVRQSGLNVEVWASSVSTAALTTHTTHLVTLVASIAPGQTSTTGPLTVVADLAAQYALGSKAIPLPVHLGLNLAFPGIVLCWYILLYQLMVHYWPPQSSRSRRRPFSILSLVLLVFSIAVIYINWNIKGSAHNSNSRIPLEIALGQAMFITNLVMACLLAIRVPVTRWDDGTWYLVAGLGLVPGLLLRWDWIQIVQQVRLQADALGYLEIANWMTVPWDGLYREPFFPLLLKLWFMALDTGPLQARMLTCGLSLILGAIILIFLKPIFNRLWQILLIGILYSTHTLLAHSAAMGLREELVPLLILWTILAVPTKNADKIGSWILPGILAGLLVLTRINLLTVIIPLAAGAVALSTKREERPRWYPGLALMVGIVVLMQLPNSLVLASRFGDPLHTSNKHATWYRNAEFADQPGHITRAEFELNSYAGEQVTWGKYLFGMHSLRDLTTGTLAGLYGFTLGKPAQDTLFRFSSRPVVQTEYYTASIPDQPQRWWELLLMITAAIGWLRGLFWPGIQLRIRLTAWTLLLFLLPLAPLQGWGLLPGRLLFTLMPLYLILLADLLAAMTDGWKEMTKFDNPEPPKLDPPIAPAPLPM